MRGHRTSVGAIIGFAGILAAGCNIEAQTSSAEGSFDRTLQVGDAPDVSITSRSGEVRVHIGAAGTVTVHARIQAHGATNLLRSLSPERQVRRLESDPPVDQRGDRIIIGELSDSWLLDDVSISYDVLVPPNARLTTVTRSGEQTLAAVSGPIDASTRSGNIRIIGAPAERWTVETRSGDVELQTPEGAGYDVSVQTRSGAIRTKREVENNSDFTRHDFRARVGSGGARVAVHTRSGSVTIQ